VISVSFYCEKTKKYYSCKIIFSKKYVSVAERPAVWRMSGGGGGTTGSRMRTRALPQLGRCSYDPLKKHLTNIDVTQAVDVVQKI